MKQTILFLFILISLGAAAQTSAKDSLVMKQRIDSVKTLVQTKLYINASFIDSVFVAVTKEMRKSYSLDEQEKYTDAIQAQQYLITRLVMAWREQYAIKIKKP